MSTRRRRPTHNYRGAVKAFVTANPRLFPPGGVAGAIVIVHELLGDLYLEAYVADGPWPPGTPRHELAVRHDNGCGILRGTWCDCQPRVTPLAEYWREEAERN
jgi:hypothetical protein